VIFLASPEIAMFAFVGSLRDLCANLGGRWAAGGGDRGSLSWSGCGVGEKCVFESWVMILTQKHRMA
jgi:hypothetical protein